MVNTASGGKRSNGIPPKHRSEMRVAAPRAGFFASRSPLGGKIGHAIDGDFGFGVAAQKIDHAPHQAAGDARREPEERQRQGRRLLDEGNSRRYCEMSRT